MDSRQTFFDAISSYYINISDGTVPPEFIKELAEEITNHFYEQYTRFGKQYPKSQKRYTTFQLKDLTHPHTFETVIKYFKEKSGDNYHKYCEKLLDMSREELLQFEKNRGDFYKMW